MKKDKPEEVQVNAIFGILSVFPRHLDRLNDFSVMVSPVKMAGNFRGAVVNVCVL